MARTFVVVLLFALAFGTSIAQSGEVKAVAKGGYRYIGFEGEASGSMSGEISLNVKSASEFMLVLKDVGGITAEGQNEAIIFFLKAERSTVKGNSIFVSGKGTFQGEKRQIEITITDSKTRNGKDAFKIRVIHNGRVEFEHSANIDPSIISITGAR